MRHLRALGLATVLVASVMVLGSPAAASPGASETIVLLRNAQGVESGWSASGVFSDAGSWTTNLGICGACAPSPVVGALYLLATQTGSNGTFTLQFQYVFDAFGIALPQQWSVVSGTGGYATLRGRGEFSVTTSTDGSRAFTLTGQVHFD
jgi:Protein of unknown function (DUF3224)